MGLTTGQVNSITAQIHNDAGKLRAVYESKVKAVGRGNATAALVEACRNIPHPIIGAVMDEITK